MTPQMPVQDLPGLARRLLAHEAKGNHPGESLPAASLVIEKLRRPLSRLAGTAGFRSLLSRALTLARAKVPSLSAVQINPDGTLEGLDAINDHSNATGAGVVVIAQLLALLVLFIGESLVLNMVFDIWPDLAVPEPELRTNRCL